MLIIANVAFVVSHGEKVDSETQKKNEWTELFDLVWVFKYCCSAVGIAKNLQF